MTWAGKQSEQPRSFQSPEKYLLLTFPFIERACMTGLATFRVVGKREVMVRIGRAGITHYKRAPLFWSRF